jgi:hypothetical protein
MASTENDELHTCEEIRSDWREIAKAEVQRYRCRLGLLSPEQELEVETVLVSVADHVFEQVIDGTRGFSGLDRLSYLNVWRRVKAAA